jgi:hypothetical protein
MILDFQFDHVTGESRIVIDFHDESLTALEINEAIQSGALREQAVNLADRVLGSDIANRVRRGEIPLVCLDHEPDPRKAEEDVPPIPLSTPGAGNQKIRQ